MLLILRAFLKSSTRRQEHGRRPEKRPRAIIGDREAPRSVGAAGNERRPVAGSVAVAVGAIAERESARLMLHVGWRPNFAYGTYQCARGRS